MVRHPGLSTPSNVFELRNSLEGDLPVSLQSTPVPRARRGRKHPLLPPRHLNPFFFSTGRQTGRIRPARHARYAPVENRTPGVTQDHQFQNAMKPPNAAKTRRTPATCGSILATAAARTAATTRNRMTGTLTSLGSAPSTYLAVSPIRSPSNAPTVARMTTDVVRALLASCHASLLGVDELTGAPQLGQHAACSEIPFPHSVHSMSAMRQQPKGLVRLSSNWPPP